MLVSGKGYHGNPLGEKFSTNTDFIFNISYCLSLITSLLKSQRIMYSNCSLLWYTVLSLKLCIISNIVNGEEVTMQQAEGQVTNLLFFQDPGLWDYNMVPLLWVVSLMSYKILNDVLSAPEKWLLLHNSKELYGEWITKILQNDEFKWNSYNRVLKWLNC